MGGVDKASLELNGTTAPRSRPRRRRPAGFRDLRRRQRRPPGRRSPLHRAPRPEPHAGVLPALLAALDAATSPLLLLLACDMPFVNRNVVGFLLDLAATHDAVMPYVQSFPQPMHAIYRVAPCRVAIRSLLEDEGGGRRMISFLDDVNTARVHGRGHPPDRPRHPLVLQRQHPVRPRSGPPARRRTADSLPSPSQGAGVGE